MSNKSEKPTRASAKPSAKKPVVKKAAAKKPVTKKALKTAAKGDTKSRLEQYFAAFLVNLGEFDQLWRGPEEPDEGELEARFDSAITELEMFARLMGVSFHELYLRLIPEHRGDDEEEQEG